MADHQDRTGGRASQWSGSSPGQDRPPRRAPAHATTTEPRPQPVTADAFLETRNRAERTGPATWGWRGAVRRMSGGLISPRMNGAEREHHRNRSLVQRSFDGPRTIVFVNPKGGAAKTTSVLMSGYTFGTVRGGGVVAWDNNETRGTLGVRGLRASHTNTARELLAARERFSDVFSARLGDLGGYVRSQGEAHFDLLASDEQPGVTGTVHATDFQALHGVLDRFYRMILVDTGNNIRAENWLAAVDRADLLVVTTTVREDTGYSGLWMLDALAAEGRQDLVGRSITILSDPAPTIDKELARALTDAYESRSRAVCRVPFDPALVSGAVVDYARLSDGTRDAWLRACAAMAGAL
ncbi:MAG: MinD/ParA family ATP-binding protein [Nocardioidaceae bacterium]